MDGQQEASESAPPTDDRETLWLQDVLACQAPAGQAPAGVRLHGPRPADISEVRASRVAIGKGVCMWLEVALLASRHRSAETLAEAGRENRLPTCA